MQNAAIAEVFDEIADYMELAGENSFKIRAYRRAAEAVATFSEPIEDAEETGALQNIEGLGEATTAKVKEFLATGKVHFLERLREQFPVGLLDLIRVPGLGPKRVSQLYKEKQIDSIEALNTALENDALKGVSGFGLKTLDNIKSGLRRMAQMTKRLPLGDALSIAQAMTDGLSTQPHVERAEIAGSVRRGVDTVGDINLLISSENAAASIESFLALPQVLLVNEQSTQAASVRVRPGIEVRLRAVAPDDFGFQLFQATGSRAHFEVAQKLAVERGLEFREDGIIQNGKPLQTRDEIEIYKLLDVPFIAPELRENKGEWQAAQNQKLPELLELKDIRGDLHSHSTWSDGAVSIRQMAQAMQARGYDYFAVTDHSKALAMANGLNAARLRVQAKEIAEVQAEFPDLKILRGIECDIMRDGSMDLDDEILHELDIVVASVHSAFNLDEATQTARVLKAIAHPAVDIIGHPTGRILGTRPSYDIHIPELIAAAREYSTCLEINASERLDLSDENAFAAREAGVLLSIDSDAHSTRMLPNVSLGVTTARRAWCEKKDILNAKTTDELLKWLNRPQSK